MVRVEGTGVQALSGLKIVEVRQISLYLQTSRLPPHCFLVRISPIHECIWVVGVLQVLDPTH